jgi:hypothetical protein
MFNKTAGTITFSTDIPAKASSVCQNRGFYGSCPYQSSCNTAYGPQISSSADKLNHTITKAYCTGLALNPGYCDEAWKAISVTMEPDPIPPDRTIETAYLGVNNYLATIDPSCNPYQTTCEWYCSGCANRSTANPCCVANCGEGASQSSGSAQGMLITSLDVSTDKKVANVSAKIVPKETMVINPDMKIELQYGFKPNKYIKTIEVKKDAENNLVAQIPNLHARTYHLRYQITDQNNKTTYSEDKTLKYGHWLPRFFNDLFGNVWEWIKSRIRN